MRKLVAKILKAQAVSFLKRHNPRVVVIAGSVGKTSTTQAISVVLAQKLRVRSTLHNYNTDLGVPCSIFGQTFPVSVKNPFAWASLLWRNERQIRRKPDFDVLVLELGTDQPGDIPAFSYLKPNLAIVTAVAPEHMEFFDSIDDVAREELSVIGFSNKVFYNQHLVDKQLITEVAESLGRSSDNVSTYDRSDVKSFAASLAVIGEHSLDAVAAAQAVARTFGMDDEEIAEAAKLIKPQPGRMQPLEGLRYSKLIDDTYNASPEAVKAALEYLFAQHAPQKIALLGQMNELGNINEPAHREIGKMCSPKNLDLVVTLGAEANRYLAEEAEVAGCKVMRTNSPVEAGQKIKAELKEGALVLLKGSQNGVFAEEAVKVLLARPTDKRLLVRQSPGWLKKKRQQFQDMI